MFSSSVSTQSRPSKPTVPAAKIRRPQHVPGASPLATGHSDHEVNNVEVETVQGPEGKRNDPVSQEQASDDQDGDCHCGGRLYWEGQRPDYWNMEWELCTNNEEE